MKPTNAMIENLIQCEVSYVNTNHPDFIGGNLLSKATTIETPESSPQSKNYDEDFFDDEGKSESKGFFGRIFGGSGSSKEAPKKVDKHDRMDAISVKVSDTLSERDKLQVQLISKDKIFKNSSNSRNFKDD